ncbi:hypothetical protein [Peribacillus deserti]|uniref:Uncharacterized protein n=1 Tax=Peribacillus deserti TaxID=673318 RepID=A0A2N5MAK1_9BACI|nr:hypothetical protein [Peribacillus deserti]PLT31389.1 hypothetical protein CUU66_02670 [Peribacillus deserti]
MLGMLKKAGLVTVRTGAGGAALPKILMKKYITSNIYRAIEVVKEKLFQVHEKTNQDYPVGDYVQKVLSIFNNSVN